MVLTVIGKKNSRKLLQGIKEKFVEITEGSTKILVLDKSINDKVPPKKPVFFNPAAKLNRDFSILAYSAFWNDFDKPKIFLDGLAGVGARSLRVANEIKDVEKVVINDVNSDALDVAQRSARLNNISNFEISENETCRFFSLFSQKDSRGSVVDIDPFGSPTKYFDCSIRATMHGGLLSVTATDMQVLHGLAKNACKRKYYGVPIKTEYSNEIAIRLILGCLYAVSGRLGIQIIPQFVQTHMHYYRIFVKVLTKKDQNQNLGYISHCFECGNRIVEKKSSSCCDKCNGELNSAGPLWIGQLFDKKFVNSMLNEIPKFIVDKKCVGILEKSVSEAEMPATYYTLDKIASKIKGAPIKMKNTIKILQDAGYLASPTSLNPTGFRTNCTIDEVVKLFEN